MSPIRSPRSPTTTSPSGRVVDAISHSQFWKSTAIFVDEDDTQNGVDHVDGHRGPMLVISPYSKPGVDDQYYTQLNMVRTIEQILGIKPMNQEDGSAEPMYGAFTAHPDFAPFDVMPNQIPLTLGAAPRTRRRSPRPAAEAAITHARPKAACPRGSCPRRCRASTRSWQQWSGHRSAPGSLSTAQTASTRAAEPLRLVLAHDWKVAYPGDPKIYRPTRCRAATSPPRSSATTEHQITTGGDAAAAPSGAAAASQLGS